MSPAPELRPPIAHNLSTPGAQPGAVAPKGMAPAPISFSITWGANGDIPKRFHLRTGEESVSIGRNGKCDIVLALPGVSWTHAEIKNIDGKLSVVDRSSNHTGIKRPGDAIVKLAKDIPTEVPNQGVIVMPMKIKNNTEADTDSMRTCFMVEIDGAPAPPVQPDKLRKQAAQAREEADETPVGPTKSGEKAKPFCEVHSLGPARPQGIGRRSRAAPAAQGARSGSI